MLLTHALYHDPSTSIHGNEALLFNFNHYSNGLKIKRITLLIYLWPKKSISFVYIVVA